MSKGFLVLVLFLFSPRADAGEVSLEGNFIQGGLVIGKTEPGNRVELDGKRLALSTDGRFLIGFGRDAPDQAVLNITGSDGKSDRRTLNVATRQYKVQRIDGLPAGKVTPKPEDVARIKADNAGIGRVRGLDTADAYFAGGFIWPVTGPLSGVFGSQRILNGKPKNPHNGTDIAAPEGTIIKAPSDARVALVNDDMFYTGKTLMLDHGLGLTSVYAHMSAILVKQGAMVKKGTPIGKVGKTGRVTGAHLHWGVTLGRTHLDPALIAGKMP
ncbi:MAG: M23 family metallopeptidase [Rhodospirillaceae bacterium]|nr:M23 family metallopeptidase [Rhodospirillaceae bacterium]MBL6942529.1 M23 family metallopeptidase [Rhodospirillales bacterium]